MTLNRAQKVLDRIEQLAAISDHQDGVCRVFGSQASRRANDLVAQWMSHAGLQVRIDNMLNIRGTRSFHSSKTFLMGSHLDTVVNAGKFDGPLGVLLGLDQAERWSGLSRELPFNLEIVGFSDEEGVRFKTPYLGSMAIAGTFTGDLLNLRDADQITLRQVIRDAGKSEQQIPGDSFEKGSLAGYLEVHIEQGPILDNLELPVGLVSGIAAQQRYQVTIRGTAGHAGTVPMDLRKDALSGAAELVLEVERTVRTVDAMVATVGKLEVWPGASNVIPEKVTLSVDIRHHQEETLRQALEAIKNRSRIIGENRELEIHWETQLQKGPVKCDGMLSEKLKNAIVESGYPLKYLTSGAGHDAVILSDVTPVCMLFVRCKRGISHHPLEETSLGDIQAAIRVCDNFFDNLHSFNL